MNTEPLSFANRILTVRQVAEYLQISKAKIYYMISRKQMPHIRIGRNVRVRQSDLQTWLETRIEKVKLL